MRRKVAERLLILAPLTAIIIFIAIIWAKGHITFYDLNFDKLGGIGGFIGGIVGTYLTLIATLYVYKTFHTQNEELESQKEELKAQKQLISQQQFESTFFNLLNVHRELKRDIAFERKNSLSYVLEALKSYPNSFPDARIVEGQDVFELVNVDLEKLMDQPSLTITTTTLKSVPDIFNRNRETINDLYEFSQQMLAWSDLQIVNMAYNKIFKIYKNQISHYSRNIYHILKFIRENELNENSGKDSKMKFQQYADILQSQLSVEEQKLLFYNFIVFDEPKKKEFSTINLVNHYKFLENVGVENLIRQSHTKLYNIDFK